jgi:hypothetical protein
MSDSRSINLNFAGFPTLLTIAFIVLKLMGKIAWSWWWVLAPMWISAGVTIFILLLLLAIAILVAAAK